MRMNDFEGFPKIPRYSRECIITEKIDGTNGQIFITEDDFLVGSRTRWLRADCDNFGFFAWANEHRAELIRGLGPGRHFGEWWGEGIQRSYALKEKRFSLFNVSRWADDEDRIRIAEAFRTPGVPDMPRPACCHVVPLLSIGEFGSPIVDAALGVLQYSGSRAAPGFFDPEGIVIYHVAGRATFKKTFENDGQRRFRYERK